MARNPTKPLRPRKDKTIVKATSNLEETLGKFKYCVKGGAVYLSELQSGVLCSRSSLHTFQMAKDALQLGPSTADMEALGYIFPGLQPILQENSLDEIAQIIVDLERHIAELKSRIKLWLSIDRELANLKRTNDHDEGPFGGSSGGGDLAL